jgi:hypothetical protein
VELGERQNVIARIVPAQAESAPDDWPDFAGRRQKIFGKRVLSGADFAIEEAVAFEYLRGQQFLGLPLSFIFPIDIARKRSAA